MIPVLDPKLTGCIIDWECTSKNSRLLDASIFKKTGEFIGKIKSENNSSKKYSLLDEEDKIILTIYKRKDFKEYAFEINDSNDFLIGKAKEASSEKKEMMMTDEQGTVVLLLKGPKNPPGVYQIDNTAGNNVAKFVLKIEKIKKFLGLRSKSKNSLLLQINHPTYNRSILIGFLASILASFVEENRI